jgi:hypothetical protein
MSDIKIMGVKTNAASGNGKNATVGASDIGFVGGSLDVTGSATFRSNMDVLGNLNVTGDIVSGGSSNVIIKDKFIDLGVGAVGAQNTGITFSVAQGSVTANLDAINSATGEVTISNIAGGVFADGDIIVVSGATASENDGLYYIKANGISPTSVTISAVPESLAPFLQTSFHEDQGLPAGNVSKVNLAALAVSDGSLPEHGDPLATIPVGTLCQAYKPDATVNDFKAWSLANQNGGYTYITSDATLQDAYDQGNTITTANNRSIEFTLGDGDLDVFGPGDVNFGATPGQQIGNFNVLSTGVLSMDLTKDQDAPTNATFSVNNPNPGVSADSNIFFSVNSTPTMLINTVGASVGSGKVLSVANAGNNADLFSFSGATGVMQLSNPAGSENVIKRTASGAGDDLRIKVEGQVDSSLILESNGTASDAMIFSATHGGIQATSVYSSTYQMTANSPDDVALFLIAGNSGLGRGDLILSSGDEILFKNGTGPGATDIASIDASSLSMASGKKLIASSAAVGGGFQFSLDAVVILENSDDDTLADASVNALVTERAIKAYVDTTTGGLGLIGNADTDGFSVNLASQSLTVSGGSNINTVGDTAQELTINLDDVVAVGTSLTSPILGTALIQDSTLTNNAITIAGTGAVTIDQSLALATGVSVTDLSNDDTLGGVNPSSGSLVTELAIKTYVDGKFTAVTLNGEGDSASAFSIDLDADTFGIAGGSNITTTGSGTSLTVDLDNNVVLSGPGAGLTSPVVNTTDIQSITGSKAIEIAGAGAVTVTTTLGLASGSAVSSILDQDDMASDSDTALATQQSIKAYVDSRGFSSFSSVTEMVTDVAISAGQVVAIQAGTGKAILADADTVTGAANVIGFALEASTGTAGEIISVAQAGSLGGFTALSAGSEYFLSATAGGIVTTAPSTAGQTVYRMGYAKSTTEIIIAPQFVAEVL